MTQPSNPPPQAVLSQMINSFWLSHTIIAVARLRVADQLAAGPKPVDELARALDAHPEALYRVLRACASVGIFAEREGRTFAQTPLSEALRSDVPGSMHGLAVMSGLLHLKAWPELVHSIRTGQTAFAKVFGADVFDHLPGDPEAAKAFDAAMAGYTAATSAAVAAAYDFSPFRQLVDVGGGSGALLSAILPRYPEARGISFDLPHVAERARAQVAKAGLAARIDCVGGDFFEGVPAGGDAYLLKMILHDWDDARSLVILRNVRKAVRPDGRVLVMETVIDPANETGAQGKLLDVNMLVMTGGRERTEAEFRALFQQAGFQLTRIVPAHPAASVIEGRPV